MLQMEKSKDFIIKVPRKMFKKREFQRMLSEMNFSSIESTTKASQKDIDKFLLYVKSKRGKLTKPLLDRIKDRL